MTKKQRERYRKRCGALRQTLQAAGNLEEAAGATKEGAEFVAIAREARGRVENGTVWSLEGDLTALGVPVDEDTTALLTRVVAHHISERSQDARAVRLMPRDAS